MEEAKIGLKAKYVQVLIELKVSTKNRFLYTKGFESKLILFAVVFLD